MEIDDPAFDTRFQVTVTRAEGRVVRVARDVGEQHRIHAQLVQADKLAAVGLLATSVAHEVDNPTAFITSNLHELRRYLGSYEAALTELAAVGLEAGAAERVRALLQRGDVAFARREATAAIGESLQGMERIHQMVASLRSVARRDQPTELLQPVELGEVVSAVVRTAAHELRSASARVDARDGVWVLGRRSELVDVVLNLVVNAVQARDPYRPNHIAVELRPEGRSALVRVRDTGRGIGPAHLRRLYTPFFTTKLPGDGAGLGLAVARNVILAHGGTIDVESAPGVGTTFTVRLPLLEADEAAPPARLGAVGTGRAG
jgi:polar amino acid transport system substrate-binding protein